MTVGDSAENGRGPGALVQPLANKSAALPFLSVFWALILHPAPESPLIPPPHTDTHPDTQTHTHTDTHTQTHTHSVSNSQPGPQLIPTLQAPVTITRDPKIL